ILVNNPGTWSDIYAPLRHAEWHGLTPTDLVFPFFMFIMGVSTYMSLRKYDFRLSWAAVSKITRRTAVIFLIGLILAWIGLLVGGIASGAALIDAALSFDHIRILGVLPRLALAYGVASLVALAWRNRYLPVVAVGLLVVYSVILIFGNGFAFSEDNVIAVVDRCVLGENHMYTDWVGGVRLHFDPEGLLGIIPSVAHVLIGFMVGEMLMSDGDNSRRALKVLILGTSLTFAGLLLSYGIPVNKKIWSPTFVLTTCGLASSLLGLLIYVIDVRKHAGWCRFFEVFGVNPLALYVLATVLSIYPGWMVQGPIMESCLIPLCCGNMKLASLVFALLFVGIIWLAGLPLYK
ncbi:MAG: DUF5009 domain-containing protein, partial [Paramuribaculum sp.]|nr:DUF5009 domain-containing protein [Paramuribaculum sp.]